MKLKTSRKQVIRYSLCFMTGALASWYFLTPGTKANVFIQNNPQLFEILNNKDIQIQSIPPSLTTVEYDGSRFKPEIVTVETGRYVGILNKSSQKQMWLISEYDSLNTRRIYGESELLKAPMDIEGVFRYADKLNPGAQGVVIVKNRI